MHFPNSSRLLAALLLAVACVSILPTASAQADSDGDGITNVRELNGFVFNISTGAIDTCNPATDSPCYVTDPLSWSSDGDPYSDFQEASGVNMDATVRVPYNSPLVAAYPVIEVSMNQYTFTSNATITDSNGQTLSSGASTTNSFESTASASVSVTASASVADGFGVSGTATASYSETTGYSGTQTSGQEINWETASSTNLDNAGTLSMSLLASNSGGATALNVRPTFNIYIGVDLVATVLPDVPFRQSLAPGESSAPVVPLVNGTPLAVQLTFERLVALQRGAPVRIQVVDILADIQRWRPQDSNWECGTGDTCSWTSFQNQILPRTLRLLVDFGYSGDPEGTVPFQFRGNPFEYRVYTGSPSTSPSFTLRDVLKIVDFDIADVGGTASIEGRAYPSNWVLAEQADAGGFTPIEQNWEAAGRPQNLLGVIMPRQATLFMTSPDPESPGVAIRQNAVTPDFLSIRAQALPRGGLPIANARAVVMQNGATVEVPLVLAESGAYWTTEGSDVRLDNAIGVSSSFVEFTDISGAVQRSDGIGFSITPVASCADISPNDLFNVIDGAGSAILFPTGDLDAPIEAYCVVGSDITRYWVPQMTGLPANRVRDLEIRSDSTILGIGQNLVVLSSDLGRSWMQVPSVPASLWTSIDSRPGIGTVVAMGRQTEQEGRAMRSTDGGLTWARLSGSFGAGLRVKHGAANVWFSYGGAGFIATPQLNRSVDDGRTWSRVTLPRTLRGVQGLEFSDNDTGILVDSDYFNTGSKVFRTVDGGQTWAEVFSRAGRTLSGPVYAGNETWFMTFKDTYTTSNPPVLYRSTQNGASGTWETIALAPFGIMTWPSILFTSPQDGVLSAESGMYSTSDGGSTWDLVEEYADNTYRVTPRAALDGNRVLALGGTTGIAMTTTGGNGMMLVANDPFEPTVHETRFELAPNVPNPFRSRTEFTFVLDYGADVTLAVYDLLGREVARLVDGDTPAGVHRATFDASSLAAGMYVARLLSGDRVETRRLTVIR